MDMDAAQMIVRRVNVDRTRSAQEALDATSRVQDLVYSDVVDAMPGGENKEVDVIFCKLNLPVLHPSWSTRFVTHYKVEEELARHGLRLADPYTLAAVNEADPDFADQFPNCTQWQDSEGEWCCLFFPARSEGEVSKFSCYGNSEGWPCSEVLWFPGIRK